MKHTNYRGKVSCMTVRDGKPFERGREWFAITSHEDGQRTLRMQCELDDRHLVRDVTYTLDPQLRPLDCFVRLHKHGQFLGSGWCRFTATEAECETYSAQLGRVSQRVGLAAPARAFGMHPVNGDALLVTAFDHSKPELIQPAHNVFISSLEHDGSSGPLVLPIGFSIEYLGREPVATKAGTFEADHYRFLLERTFPADHPTEEIWCMPETYFFVKAQVGGYINTTFELVEFTRE